mmetsp:Transcript_67290/g.169816  ORF Transcript_67290/g.169816 Transcript_67290/m.169816 type:complete len:213 (+) Transcript_67290:476-1114(+)
MQVGIHVQVWTIHHWSQEGPVGGQTNATHSWRCGWSSPLGHFKVPNAWCLRVYEVSAFGDSNFVARVSPEVQDGPRQCLPRNFQRPFSAQSASIRQSRWACCVIHQALEVSPMLCPAPRLILQQLSPTIVILCLATLCNHAIDAAGASERLTPRVEDRTPIEPRLLASLKSPIRAVLRVSHCVDIAHGNVNPMVPVITTCLDHCDADLGIGA